MTITATTNSQLLALVTAVLGAFDKEDRIFSAFDVTKGVRNELNRIKNPVYGDHFTIRELVHEFYDKELPPFQNGSDYVREDYTDHRGVTFQVYRKVGTDINSYNQHAVKVHPTSGVAVIPSKNIGPVHSSKGGTATAFNPSVQLPTPVRAQGPTVTSSISFARRGSRGRVLIHAKDLRSIGARPGDSIGVYSIRGTATPEIMLKPAHESMPNGATCDALTSLKVDKYGELRLGNWIVENRLGNNIGLTVDTFLKTITLR